jgi:hypothetical protein
VCLFDGSWNNVLAVDDSRTPYLIDAADATRWFSEASINHERTAKGKPQEPEIIEYAGIKWMLKIDPENNELKLVASSDEEELYWSEILWVDENLEVGLGVITTTKVDMS